MKTMKFKCENSTKSENARYNYTTQFNGDVVKTKLNPKVTLESMSYFFMHTDKKIPLKTVLELDMNQYKITKNEQGFPWLEPK